MRIRTVRLVLVGAFTACLVVAVATVLMRSPVGRGSEPQLIDTGSSAAALDAGLTCPLVVSMHPMYASGTGSASSDVALARWVGRQSWFVTSGVKGPVVFHRSAHGVGYVFESTDRPVLTVSAVRTEDGWLIDQATACKELVR